MKHTKEPWQADTVDILDSDKNEIATTAYSPDDKSLDECKANAERIVACVNAMDGIEDPAQFREEYAQFKRIIIEDIDAMAKMQEQNIELLAALEKFTILNPDHYRDIAGFINHAKDLVDKYKKR